MPLETTTYVEPAPDLSRPSLVALSYALRHPETWPQGFMWDYGDCDTCAMGLAVKLWNTIVVPSSYCVSKAMKISQWDAQGILLDLPERLHTSHAEITPLHVADAIDAYLASRAP